MAVNISYMGTKRELAPIVADVIQHAQKGVLLDAFSGMCLVGEQVGQSRQVWNNDAQVFAAEVARALFASRDEPPRPLFIVNRIYSQFEKHQRTLEAMFPRSLIEEQRMLDSDTYDVFCRQRAKLSRTLKREQALAPPRRANLFSLRYSNNYFGVKQAIAIDAICDAIFSATKATLISEDQRRWLLIALGRGLLKISNSTGHFAQYLTPREGSFKRYLRQRRRNIWQEWLYSTGELNPVGHMAWRRGNKAFNEDSLGLIPRLRRLKKVKPAVIYADPPYTDDQYSRFYHILDTLILYDYPATSGVGLYRSDRFITSFSHKANVVESFHSLVSSASKLGADLVLSYPTNGLLHEAETTPTVVLKKYFRRVERCYSASHCHSTFGASKGVAKSPVTEVIYLARQ